MGADLLPAPHNPRGACDAWHCYNCDRDQPDYALDYPVSAVCVYCEHGNVYYNA